jgi:hypothetical protein
MLLLVDEPLAPRPGPRDVCAAVGIALGVASPLEVAASAAIGLLTVVVVARLASAIYQRATVRTGSRTHLRDLVRSSAA